MTNVSAPLVPPTRIDFSAEDRAWIVERISEVLASGQLTLGRYGATFEKEFAAMTGAKHAVAVNSGTASLEIMMRVADVRGKDVLVPANTFIATASAVIAAGGNPVLMDTDVATHSTTPAEIAFASVQVHSEDPLGKIRPRLTSKFLSHRRRPAPISHMGPGLRGCNPIGLHRPFATNCAIPAQAGTHSAAGVELSGWTRSQKRSNSGACGSMGPGRAGMARKGNSRIVTMFIEAKWITASEARDPFRHGHRPPVPCQGQASPVWRNGEAGWDG